MIDEYTLVELVEEEDRIERIMSVSEIFEAGYNAGHANAGLHSRYAGPYRAWLVSRLERIAKP